MNSSPMRDTSSNHHGPLLAENLEFFFFLLPPFPFTFLPRLDQTGESTAYYYLSGRPGRGPDGDLSPRQWRA